MTPRQQDRLWSRAVQDGDCWIWTGATNGVGYGIVRVDKVKHYVHRLAYELLRADIPPGLVIDHLCRRRNCLNPWHLEPVTAAENAHRRPLRPACPAGHAYTSDNSYFQAGRRTPECRICHRNRQRLRQQRRTSNSGRAATGKTPSGRDNHGDAA